MLTALWHGYVRWCMLVGKRARWMDATSYKESLDTGAQEDVPSVNVRKHAKMHVHVRPKKQGKMLLGMVHDWGRGGVISSAHFNDGLRKIDFVLVYHEVRGRGGNTERDVEASPGVLAAAQAFK